MCIHDTFERKEKKVYLSLCYIRRLHKGVQYVKGGIGRGWKSKENTRKREHETREKKRKVRKSQSKTRKRKGWLLVAPG